ncbi:hypothetical protein ABDK00_016830 [Niabella insulamsoli]|uniref:hypothetical protein n=1 Tax=Niabella insulamsoli TaxID=3144874 RepID=UPI0031FD477C
MKKLIVLSILVALSSIQSCHVKRKVQRSSAVVDSVHVKSKQSEIKQERKDSVGTNYFENFYKIFSTMEFTADKVIKTDRVQPSELKFVLNVDQLQVSGDTAKAVDKNTGTEATIYKTPTGELAVNIKPQRSNATNYELINVKLKTSHEIDTSKSGGTSAATSTTTNTTQTSEKDSSSLKKQTKNKSVDVEKKFGALKVIGLVVLVVGVLWLLVLLFKKTTIAGRITGFFSKFKNRLK